jgi:hypothetical protein
MALSGQIGIDLLLMENPGNVKDFLSLPYVIMVFPAAISIPDCHPKDQNII